MTDTEETDQGESLATHQRQPQSLLVWETVLVLTWTRATGVPVLPNVSIDLVEFLVLPPLLPVHLREQLNTLDLSPTRNRL